MGDTPTLRDVLEDTNKSLIPGMNLANIFAPLPVIEDPQDLVEEED